MITLWYPLPWSALYWCYFNFDHFSRFNGSCLVHQPGDFASKRLPDCRNCSCIIWKVRIAIICKFWQLWVIRMAASCWLRTQTESSEQHDPFFAVEGMQILILLSICKDLSMVRVIRSNHILISLLRSAKYQAISFYVCRYVWPDTIWKRMHVKIAILCNLTITVEA